MRHLHDVHFTRPAPSYVTSIDFIYFRPIVFFCPARPRLYIASLYSKSRLCRHGCFLDAGVKSEPS